MALDAALDMLWRCWARLVWAEMMWGRAMKFRLVQDSVT